MKKERDYILGTHEEELERLGLQHQIWRPHALEGWHKAGLTRGMKVLDIGAGPGYATQDLAEIVGKEGEVVAVERSNNYLQHLKKNSAGQAHIRAYETDLMEDDIPERDFDFSWCRWVTCFVSNPEILVQKNYNALKKGAKAIFHEYIDYATWKFVPRSELQEQFVAQVIKNWRETGGEPNIAGTLPDLLTQQGFHIQSMRPLIFVIRPTDFMWHWPLSFIEINLARQLELGKIEKTWADQVMQDLEDRCKAPNATMITPMVMEIIAEK